MTEKQEEGGGAMVVAPGGKAGKAGGGLRGRDANGVTAVKRLPAEQLRRRRVADMRAMAAAAGF